jgi:hypothetical protein
MRQFKGFLVIVLFCMASLAFGQQKIKLATALQEQQIKAVNRSITLYDKSPGSVEMDAVQGDGMGVLKEISFETGSIEVDILGENSPGRSFVGIAFNIQDKETFEAVYFRPFNFVATEQIRKDHMVQYIYHPDYTWSKLREEKTGEFENEILAPPDPDDWFRATIRVSEKWVEVFVDEGKEPVLKVERLGTSKSDKIGLWTGNNSSGRFRNLVITGS